MSTPEKRKGGKRRKRREKKSIYAFAATSIADKVDIQGKANTGLHPGTIERTRLAIGVVGLSAVLQCSAAFSPASSVRSVHADKTCEDITCSSDKILRMAAAAVPKAVRKVIPAPRPHWVGNGFHVFPVFGELAFTQELSPWLMFDYAAPKHFDPSTQRRGVGQHPHRGFETITIAFQGEVEHGDSVGNQDVIGPGDVQWMTAARGIIHEEVMPRVVVLCCAVRLCPSRVLQMLAHVACTLHSFTRTSLRPRAAPSRCASCGSISRRSTRWTPRATSPFSPRTLPSCPSAPTGQTTASCA